MYATTHLGSGVPPHLPLAAKTQSPVSYAHTAALKTYLGEQAAYVYSSLYAHSRQTLAQLGQRTQLKPRQLKQLLAALIQIGCVVYTLDKPSLGSSKTITYYEVSNEGCWKLVYADEVLAIVSEKFGDLAAEIMQNVIISGNLTLGDYLKTAPKESKYNIKKEFVKLVDDKWLRPLRENETMAKRALFADCVALAIKQNNSQSSSLSMNNNGPPGSGGSSFGGDNRPKVVSQMKRGQAIKEIAREKFISKMQDVDQLNQLYNYEQQDNQDEEDDEDMNFSGIKPLNPNLLLTLDFERVLKHVRTEHLVSSAMHRLGRVTGSIYRVVLERLESKTRNVRLVEDEADRLVSGVAISMGNLTTASTGLSTTAVQAISGGLGGTTQGYDPTLHIETEKAYELKDQERGMNFNSIDILKEIKRVQPALLDDIKGTISDGMDDVSIGMKRRGEELNKTTKKIRLDKVKFEDDDEEAALLNGIDVGDDDSKLISTVLQHLKLLTTDVQLPFLMESNPGSYYIPMTLLQGKLSVFEFKQQLRATVGAKALRVLNCIEKKRLIDEKFISKEVLMKESDVRGVIAELLQLGFIEVQEIPRTADRSAVRAAFAYRVCSSPGFSRGSGNDKTGAYRSSMNMMGNFMLHEMGESIDSLITMRNDNKILLDKVSREDVKGREGELLLEGEIKQLKRVMEQERLALTQWGRLRSMGELFWFS